MPDRQNCKDYCTTCSHGFRRNLSNNRLGFLGVAILLAGMILALSIAHVINSHEYEVNATFSEALPGEFVSGTINMSNSNGILYISNNSSSVYLVPARYITGLNSSNAGQYAVVPSETGNITTGGFAYSLGSSGRLYSNLTGSYNIVAFMQSAPAVAYDRTSSVPAVTLAVYSPLVVAGEVMWVGGTILAAFGFIVGRKKKE